MPEETAVAAPPVETSASDVAEIETSTATETATDVAEETADVADASADEGSSATEQTDTESGETDSEDDLGTEQRTDDLADYSRMAGARLREMCKAAPGLQQLLDKNPKVRDSIVSSLKRDALLRENNISFAELKEYRERLPNGLQDLQTIEQELGELGRIDGAFYGKRGGELIAYMHQADPEAAVAMFRELPKQWARLDPESYNATFSAIISSTFRRDRVPETVYRAHQQAKAAGQTDLADNLAQLYNYLQSFSQQEDSSPEAQRLRAEREKFNRDRQQSSQRDQENFNSSFIRESERFQRSIVRSNPIFKKLPQSIPEAKKSRMVDLIRNQVIAHLEKSRSFMSQMEPAYTSMDLQRCIDVQRGQQGWQPWIVNMYVRKILAEETPGIIEGNRSAVDKKKTAAARTGIANRAPARTPTPAKPGDRRKTANDFTTAEIMRGEADHLIK